MSFLQWAPNLISALASTLFNVFFGCQTVAIYIAKPVGVRGILRDKMRTVWNNLVPFQRKDLAIIERE